MGMFIFTIRLYPKSDYSKSQLFGLMEGYFNNSFPAMASFFAREKDLTIKELEELLEDTKKELSKDKNGNNGSICIIPAQISDLAYRFCPGIYSFFTK